MRRLQLVLTGSLLLLCSCNGSGSGASAVTTTSSCNATETYSQNPISTSATKGAQSFQVVRAGAITSFLLYVTSVGVTRVDATLYQGGATPDSGTPIATSSVTAGLGSSTLGWLSFPLPSAPTLTPGVTYYFVFQTTGAALQLGDSKPLKDYPNGNYWSFSGSTWTMQSEDLSFGATWGC